MRSIPSQTRAALTVVLAALFGAGCSAPSGPVPSAGTPDGSPRRGGTVQLASFADIRTIDPANIADGLVPGINELIFAGIVDFDREGNVVPDLAERFEVSESGTDYRFTLRQGVRFHDGTELRADDVKRSVERSLHLTSPNSQASLYDRLQGFEEFSKGKADHLRGVTVDSEYVVSFHLREPDASFLTTLAMQSLRPVCKSAGDRYSDQWHPCGAGPFKLNPGDWDPGRGVRLARHDQYFRSGLPLVDAVQWTFHMNMSTQHLKFRAGELDLLEDLQQGDILGFLKDPRWQPYGTYKPDTQIGGESMNVEVPPFDNVEVRRAVACAIDREHLRLLKPTNMSANGRPFPPKFPGVDLIEGQHYDYDKALAHMARAGFPYDPKTGKGGYPHVIPYIVYRQGLHEYTSQVLAQELAKIGLRIEVQILNYPAYLAVTHRRKGAAISPQGWQQEYPDPSNFLDPLYHSRAIAEEDSNNSSFYKNPTVDKLLDDARRELVPEKRRQLYASAERVILDEAPWAFTFSYRWYEVRQPALKGYKAHPIWIADVRSAWLDRPGAASTAMQHAFGTSALAGLTGAFR